MSSRFGDLGWKPCPCGQGGIRRRSCSARAGGRREGHGWWRVDPGSAAAHHRTYLHPMAGRPRWRSQRPVADQGPPWGGCPRAVWNRPGNSERVVGRRPPSLRRRSRSELARLFSWRSAVLLTGPAHRAGDHPCRLLLGPGPLIPSRGPSQLVDGQPRLCHTHAITSFVPTPAAQPPGHLPG